jgi:hypothetical protein
MIMVAATTSLLLPSSSTAEAKQEFSMADENTGQAGSRIQPYVEVQFKPNEQVRPDATQIDGAFRVIPHGFMDGAIDTDDGFKALIGDGTGSMFEDEHGQQNSVRNKRNDCYAGGIIALQTAVAPNDHLALYSFNTEGRRLFPERGKPLRGTPSNIQAAMAAWNKLEASGDTFMSTGIRKAFEDFLSLDCDEGTAALITDGFNNRGDERALRAVLSEIKEFRKKGKIFKIQPIGVGADISPVQLEMIRTACLADPIEHIRLGTPSTKWGEVFAKIFNDLTAKKLRSVEISFIEKPSSTVLLNLSQQRPSVLDLTNDAVVGADEQSISVQTGGWEGDKSRLYSFSLKVRKPMTRDNIQAACLQIKYTIGKRQLTLDPIPINVRWTNIASLSSRVPAELAEARGISGSVEAITQGITALAKGNKKQAQILFQKAYDLAREAKSAAFIRDLSGYMDIDPETHIVTVRALTREDSMRLDALSKRQEADED